MATNFFGIVTSDDRPLRYEGEPKSIKRTLKEQRGSADAGRHAERLEASDGKHFREVGSG